MEVLDEANYDIENKIHITKKEVIISEDYAYRDNFQYGDIVGHRGGGIYGYVYAISEDEVKVAWMCGHSEWENKHKLLIFPLTKGIELLNWTAKQCRCDSLLMDWVKNVNGYSEEFAGRVANLDILGNKFNQVNFVEWDNDKKIVIDKKFKRDIKLYRQVGNYILYIAKLFPFAGYRNVFYLREKEGEKIYFAGIEDEVRKTLAILYTYQENN